MPFTNWIISPGPFGVKFDTKSPYREWRGWETRVTLCRAGRWGAIFELQVPLGVEEKHRKAIGFKMQRGKVGIVRCWGKVSIMGH